MPDYPYLPTIQAMCATIQENYSACDVSDALLKLNVHNAGFLPDLASFSALPYPTSPRRIVAPVSTAVLVPKCWTDASAVPPHLPRQTNIPPGQNWTDQPSPGTIVVVQQPEYHISAILGDIIITRFHHRGVLGAVVDGRIRDVQSCRDTCRGGTFQLWARGVSAAAPSLEAVPWAVDVPIHVGGVTWVRPGDILCADEGDGAVVVIPQDRLRDVYERLPVLKEASDRVLEDVQNGLSLPEAVQRHPNFYSNYQ